MRTSMRIGIVGSSIAVAGSTALAAFAPTAGAASGHASSAGYNSKANAALGTITIAGTTRSLLSASANSANGDQANSDNIGSGQLLSALKNAPAPVGPALAAALQKSNPGHFDLATVAATASTGGTSTGCAAVLAADCTAGGQLRSLVLKLGLSDLTAALAGTPLANLVSQLPDPLSAYDVVLTLNGPRASCAVGPAGSADVSATDNPAGAVVDIRANGKSILPTGPITLSTGQIFAQLFAAEKNSPLGSLLSTLSAKLPLGVIVNPNSRKYSAGPKATATADELGLTSSGMTIFDVKLADASCGPNTEAVSSAPAPGSSGTSPSTGSTSGEKPLSGIQTDEGRSAGATGARWLALTGAP